MGVIGENLAVFKDGQLVEKTRGFQLFVTAIGVNGAGEDADGAEFADFVFEGAPLAPIEGLNLRHGVACKECVLRFREVGGGGQMTAVEAGVGEGAGWERV